MLSEEEANLYDRQIRLWGADAQKRLREAKVLLIGLKALNAEVCKNIVLAGVNSVTILDHEKATEEDLGAHIFIEESEIGKNRAKASQKNISILNPHVQIIIDEGKVTEKPDSFFDKYTVICATNCSLETQIKIDSICRKNGIYFFGAENFGYFGYFFSDLTKYTFTKKPSEEESKDSEHTNATPEVINVHFSSLQDALNSSVLSKVDQLPKAFVGIQLIYAFQKQHKRFPNLSDLSELIKINRDFLATHKLKPNFLDENFLKTIAINSGTELAAVCAVLGGVLGQEIIKVISGKDEPLNNFFVFSALDLRRPGDVILLPPK